MIEMFLATESNRIALVMDMEDLFDLYIELNQRNVVSVPTMLEVLRELAKN